MKKITLFIAFIVTPLVTSAQSFFDTLEDIDGVDVVVVTKDAFEMISKFKDVKIEDNETLKVFEMIQELKELKVFSTRVTAIADQMDSLVKIAIQKQSLTELMRIKEDGSQVDIYVKVTKNKEYVSEVLMFINGIDKQTNGKSEAMIVSLTGAIDINKMAELADAFSEGKK
ncbi:MAG: Uncharacterised protein [Polaribacter sejongensis]|nr:MAG: Uncharacterised protein [Polaribacter sejongensis]|tara:strand:- start:1850 stop:2362 length:513 start_codon:yes stop_codon:yes gene_type:complete